MSEVAPETFEASLRRARAEEMATRRFVREVAPYWFDVYEAHAAGMARLIGVHTSRRAAEIQAGEIAPVVPLSETIEREAP